MISKESFSDITTPFYYYDTQLLQDTLDIIKRRRRSIHNGACIMPSRPTPILKFWK